MGRGRIDRRRPEKFRCRARAAVPSVSSARWPHAPTTAISAERDAIRALLPVEYVCQEVLAVSKALAEVNEKIRQLEASAVSRRSDPSGTRIDLQTQTKGKLPLENVDASEIIEALKSIAKALEDLENRIK